MAGTVRINISVRSYGEVMVSIEAPQDTKLRVSDFDDYEDDLEDDDFDDEDEGLLYDNLD
jgi:hypothetical protein